MAEATRINSLVLRHGDHFFGSRADVHLWLTRHDLHNANLMILLSYILLGHPDWHDAEIRIFAAFPSGQAQEESDRLQELIAAGRLPIAERRIRIIPTDESVDFDKLVEKRSAEADLVMFGFNQKLLEDEGADLFRHHSELHEVLWVCARERIRIE